MASQYDDYYHSVIISIKMNLIVEKDVQVGWGRYLKKQPNGAGGQCPENEDGHYEDQEYDAS